MFLYFVLITIILLFYLYRTWTKNHVYWRNLGVPSAKNPHWFFGHFKEIMMSTKHVGVMFQGIYNEFPNAPYVGYMKLASPGLLLRDPELIKAALSTDFNSFAKNELVVDRSVDFLIGHNPFALHGEEWKVTRGHATPLNTIAKLKTYFPNIIDVCNVMIDYIKNNASEGGSVVLETKQLAGMYTTDVVANAFFGVANNTFADKNSLFASMTREVFSGSLFDNMKLVFGFLFPKIGPLLGIRFSSKRTEEILMSLTRKIMKERTDTGVSRNDIFQQMMTYRKNDTKGLITDEYIASHCFSFIADGYETSSEVICFALFELAWNNEVQEKLREEIHAMLLQTKGEFGVEDIENLKYLNMVVSETLRLHPPGLAMAKLVSVDYQLPKTADGKIITLKKDTSVTIPTYGLHMDPKHYPNPQIFDPERFTEENIAQRHKYVYLPFGEGPRKCLGQRVGLLQIKIAIVKIIENFRLKSSTKSSYPAEIDPQVIVKRPLNGAWVCFEEIRK